MSKKLLELFAGSRSVSRVAQEMGMKKFSIDWDPYEGIDLVGDISKIGLDDIPFVPDIIWASPDCTTYSIAACSHHRMSNLSPKSNYAKECDSTNKHFISLILDWLKLNPDLVFFIENPRGILRKMDFMNLDVPNFRRETVWYCQYGDNRAKPTDIWTNSKNWVPRPQCKNGNPLCHHERAPRGSRGGTQGRKNSYERSRIPGELCREILISTEESNI
jgi:site-specific DNA-cytosine methylase